MVSWIYQENLQPFTAMVAQLAGYDLYDEEYDWVAIEYGVKDTDRRAEKWYAYPFAGEHALTLELALYHIAFPSSTDAPVAHVRITAATPLTSEVTAQFNLLVALCQRYSIRPWDEFRVWYKIQMDV